MIASFINSFYNNYITIVNFQNLMSPFINKNYINTNNDNKFKHLNKSSSNYDKDKSENTELTKNIQSKNEILEKMKDHKSKKNINKLPYIKKKADKNDSTSVIRNKENNENSNGNEEKIGNFIFYLYYKLTCNKKNKSFKNYSKFRTKIMSEEHLLKNHLDVYSLLKMCNKNEFELENKYNIKDLMNNGKFIII